MKLVRLATDNNGVFASAFQNDMTIAPQSQMALLNLTFQTQYIVLSVNDTNNKITFKSNSLVTATQADGVLNQLNYSRVDYNNFFNDLEYNLNASIADDDEQNCMSSQWFIRNYSDRKTLEFRYAPFMNPLNMSSPVTGKWDAMSYDQTLINVSTTTPPFERTTITKQEFIGATADRTCAMITNAKMSTGNGMVLIRPRISVTNGSGIQDNGFGIGLTKTNLRNPDVYVEGDDIPVDKIDFEIRYNRPAETYKYLDGGAIEKDSNVTPALVNGGTMMDHDIIYFKTLNGKVEGGVLQMGTQGYVDLTTGNNWTQAGTGTTETFDEINLGQIARYRRLQPSTPALEHWWEPTSATGWNVYTGANPPNIGDTPDTTATINPATGVITIAGTTFNPAQIPSLAINAGAYRRKFFEVAFKPGDDLYPYLYLRGATGDITVDMFNYSFDPWINQDYNNIVGVDDFASDTVDGYGWQLTGLDYEGNPSNAWENDVLSVHTGSNIFFGTGSNAFPLSFPKNWTETKTMELTLHSDIWKFLGFTDVGVGNIKKTLTIGFSPSLPVKTQCWSWYVGDKEVLPSNSDNYLVESMSLPLDSFDASAISYPANNSIYLNPGTDKRGRRKNILMTIPVNDNSNGLVEYEASTPVFIDINNAEEINAKNLNFRVLNKNFDSITQSGDTAIMTILIKKPNE